MEKNKIIIGTRGSILALAQAEKVKEMLIAANEGLEIEIKTIVTTGDKDLTDFKKMQGDSQKELFVKEIEKEMLDGEIDMAVHSLKDMPQVTPKGLINACFPLREDNEDVFISRSGKILADLKEGSIIGTGSIRRQTEILHMRSDVEVKPIRGNIHTRLKKLDDGEYDAIVLAAAGLIRVGLEHRIIERFHKDDFVAAPGQGILCVQCRENDERILKILNTIENPDVRLMCEAEREFSRLFNGGCHSPLGCSAKINENNVMELRGVFAQNGRRVLETVKGNKKDSLRLARRLAKKIKGAFNYE